METKPLLSTPNIHAYVDVHLCDLPVTKFVLRRTEPPPLRSPLHIPQSPGGLG